MQEIPWLRKAAYARIEEESNLFSRKRIESRQSYSYSGLPVIGLTRSWGEVNPEPAGGRPKFAATEQAIPTTPFPSWPSVSCLRLSLIHIMTHGSCDDRAARREGRSAPKLSQLPVLLSALALKRLGEARSALTLGAGARRPLNSFELLRAPLQLPARSSGLVSLGDDPWQGKRARPIANVESALTATRDCLQGVGRAYAVMAITFSGRFPRLAVSPGPAVTGPFSRYRSNLMRICRAPIEVLLVGNPKRFAASAHAASPAPSMACGPQRPGGAAR